ncbi:hypothetical protein WUBG_06406, partial [Wuchereria bancrofti]
FYARTPQYDNDKWYEWYRNQYMDQMETRWIRKLRRKEWIEFMVRKNKVYKMEINDLKRHPEAILKFEKENDVTAMEEKEEL